MFLNLAAVPGHSHSLVIGEKVDPITRHQEERQESATGLSVNRPETLTSWGRHQQASVPRLRTSLVIKINRVGARANGIRLRAKRQLALTRGQVKVGQTRRTRDGGRGGGSNPHRRSSIPAGALSSRGSRSQPRIHTHSGLTLRRLILGGKVSLQGSQHPRVKTGSHNRCSSRSTRPVRPVSSPVEPVTGNRSRSQNQR